MNAELDRLMRAYRLPIAQAYTRTPRYATVDTSVTAGRVSDQVARDRRSMARSGLSRGNRGTMANRRWGGSASTFRPKVEDMVGRRMETQSLDVHFTALDCKGK